MNKKIKRITFTALMTASAVVLSFVEGLIPVSAVMPPGAKIGLSNVAVMFGAYCLTLPEVLLIVLCKSIFILITRGFTAFLMSLTGGLLSSLCMVFLMRKVKDIGCIGIGVLSALCHNVGQFLVSFIMLKTSAVLGYVPIFLIMSVLSGILTGSLLKVLLPYFDKLRIKKEMER